jgi:hypothetical protein
MDDEDWGGNKAWGTKNYISSAFGTLNDDGEKTCSYGQKGGAWIVLIMMKKNLL